MSGLNLLKAFELKAKYICPNCGKMDKPCLENVDIYTLKVSYGLIEHQKNCDTCGNYYYFKIHTKERVVEVCKAN